MRIAFKLAAFVAGCLLSTVCCAQSTNDMETVKLQLKNLLKNTEVHDVRPSVIDGLYEVESAKNVFYFAPKTEHFIFGEIYTKDGLSLTQASKESVLRKQLKRAAIKYAFQVGTIEAGNTIYEFTDPLCPHCKRYESYISQRSDVKRYVFFMDRGNEKTRALFTHVFCSENKEEAYTEVHLFAQQSQTQTKLRECPEAEYAWIQHQKIVKELDVKGTPTLFVNNAKVEGFDPQTFSQLLINKEQE